VVALNVIELDTPVDPAKPQISPVVTAVQVSSAFQASIASTEVFAKATHVSLAESYRLVTAVATAATAISSNALALFAFDAPRSINDAALAVSNKSFLAVISSITYLAYSVA